MENGVKNMNMSKMMSKMMYKNNQKMPPMEMMQEMCKMMGSKKIKPHEMCMKMKRI